jgi:glutamine amidotransferase
MIGIINYGAGNLFSLECSLERINVPYFRINKPEELGKADRIIIPGVGYAEAAMYKLKEKDFIDSIVKINKPVLGICLGMQLLTESSEEGNAELLKLVPLKTIRFKEELKVPHIGWNKVKCVSDNPLFKGINEEYFYFIHSYFVPFSEELTMATTEYPTAFSSAIGCKNFVGVQFHPEKSGKAGEQLLRNFSNL